MPNYGNIPKRKYWDTMYLLLCRIIEKIHSEFPIKENNKIFETFDEYLDECLKDRYLSWTLQEYITNDKLQEWVLTQKKKFNDGSLSVEKIQKLKLIGFFQNSIGYNDDDKHIFDIYFKGIDDLVDFDNYKSESNWQLKVAKYIVKKYYHRKENQKYDMSDYIGVILEEVINLISNNEKLEFKKLERKILSKISELNRSNNKIIEVQEAQAENDTYEIDEEIDIVFLKGYVKEILNKYDEKKRKIIKYRFGIVDNENDDPEMHTYTECSKKFGLSKSGISQIEKSILRDLRFYKRSSGRKLINDYLILNNEEKRNKKFRM